MSLDFFFIWNLLTGLGPTGSRRPIHGAKQDFFGAKGSEAISRADVKFSNTNCYFNGFNDINCPPLPTDPHPPKKCTKRLYRIIQINQEFRGPRG